MTRDRDPMIRRVSLGTRLGLLSPGAAPRHFSRVIT